MADKVLVTYATRYGSTGEVAEAVAGAMRERGQDVEVRPAREVDSLDGYGPVVLGAPFYIGSLLKDATAFLETHKDSLASRPVALFTLGPIGTREVTDDDRTQIDRALGKVPWLKPVATEMFVGKYDPSGLRFADKLAAVVPASPLHGLTKSDDRDWDAIRSWAGSLTEKL